MAGQILPQPWTRLGNAIEPFAQAYFYLKGTLTPKNVYSDVDLNTAITQPVEANSSGNFPVIYYDPQTNMRMIIVSEGNDPTTDAIYDFDPVVQLVEVDESNFAAAGLIAALGFTPVGTDGSQDVEAPLSYAFSPNPPSAFGVNDLGYMGNPVTTMSGDVTLTFAYVAAMFYKASATARQITLPPNASLAWPVGYYFYAFNGNAAGNLTIARGSGVALVEAGDAALTDEDKVITPGGWARVQKVAANTWVAQGVSF